MDDSAKIRSVDAYKKNPMHYSKMQRTICKKLKDNARELTVQAAQKIQRREVNFFKKWIVLANSRDTRWTICNSRLNLIQCYKKFHLVWHSLRNDSWKPLAYHTCKMNLSTDLLLTLRPLSSASSLHVLRDCFQHCPSHVLSLLSETRNW